MGNKVVYLHHLLIAHAVGNLFFPIWKNQPAHNLAHKIYPLNDNELTHKYISSNLVTLYIYTHREMNVASILIVNIFNVPINVVSYD